ncbi:MAG: DNA-processing protein DprA [Candidatus Omnitrophota bacterium]
MTELEAKIALNLLPELSTICYKKLLDYFKNALAVFKTSPEELERACGLKKETLAKLNTLIKGESLKKELALIEKNKIKILSLDDSDYPTLLREIYDPPPILYVKGKLEKDSLKIAIVGSRQASMYGLKMTEKFGYELASCGLTIVSGMARGIDSAAHKAALKAGGKTLAVLGSGLSCIYPPENKGLFEQISNSGAVISEFPIVTRPLSYNFPRRNRIISGLSSGILIVEAAKRSGALITVNCALEQGREVFVVPGKADSPTSFGTNKLIKEGAKLVDDASEIIQELNLNPDPKLQPSKARTKEGQNLNLNERERKILDSLVDEPVLFEKILEDTDFTTAELLSCLTRLELKGVVSQLPGKRFTKKF